MSISARLVIAAVCVLATQGGSRWLTKLETRNDFETTRLPIKLGQDWYGTEAEIDPQLVRVRGALGPVVNRRYERSDGDRRRVLTHMATFPAGEVALPHLPAVCYTAAGWKLSDERTSQSGKQASIPPHRSFIAEREGQEVLVTYWYQLGPSLAGDRASLRKILQDLRLKGKRSPPLVKVLLQTEVLGSRSDAEKDAEELASEIYDWVLSAS